LNRLSHLWVTKAMIKTILTTGFLAALVLGISSNTAQADTRMDHAIAVSRSEAPATPPIILGLTASHTASVGSRMSVSLTLSGVTTADDIRAMQIGITVTDPTVLAPAGTLSPVAGSLFSPDSLTYAAASSDAWYYMLNAPLAPAAPISGSGVVAVFPFTAVANGCVTVGFSDHMLVNGDYMLVDHQTAPLQVCIGDVPTAGFQTSSPDWLGQTTVFTNTTLTNGLASTYEWDFGDGLISSAFTPTHVYTSAGLYTVVLSATNGAGATVVTDTVTVYGAPAVQFSAVPLNGVYPLTVTFTGAATTTPLGDPTLAYQWRFGDGGTNTALTSTHTYIQAGSYTVTLAVSNQAGTTALTRTNFITVAVPRPILAVDQLAPTFVITRGTTADFPLTLRNNGTAVMMGIVLTSPLHIPWATALPAGLDHLDIGGVFTGMLHVVSDPAQSLGYYRDFAYVSDANGDEVRIAVTLVVITSQRDVSILIQDDQGHPVPGADVSLQKQTATIIATEGVTQTFQPSYQAATGANGVASLPFVETGLYTIIASALSHQSTTTVVTVTAGAGAQNFVMTLTARALLSVSPRQMSMSIIRGGTANQPVAVQNTGAAPLTILAITPPPSIPWVSLETPLTQTLQPGEQTLFTIFANPVLTQTTGVYQDYVTVFTTVGQVATVALSVQVTDQTTRSVAIDFVDSAGKTLTIANGAVQLNASKLSVAATAGVAQSYSQQYAASVQRGHSGFPALPLGIYIYQATIPGFEQTSGSLTVLAGSDVQTVSVVLQPDPFIYNWQVQQAQTTYFLTLTMTYDAGSQKAELIIPPTYWAFRTCIPAVNSQISLYNPTPYTVTLTDFELKVAGVDATSGTLTGVIPPGRSLQIPVQAVMSGIPGTGYALATFTYDRFVANYSTFTFNPSSLTSPALASGDAFSQDYVIRPAIFTSGTLYTMQLTPPASLGWVSVSMAQSGAAAWDSATAIPVNLAVNPPAWLPDGFYTDTAVIGALSDSGFYTGTLNIQITKDASGVRVHTYWGLAGLPEGVTTKAETGISQGVIHAEKIGCFDLPSFPSLHFSWPQIGVPTLIITGTGSSSSSKGGGAVIIDIWPWVPPPPAQIHPLDIARIAIDQRLVMDGDSFGAHLRVDNTSSQPLEVMSVNVRVFDPGGADVTSQFVLTPSTPTLLGTVGVAGYAQQDWFITPNGLGITDTNGRHYSVQATMSYTWAGAAYSVQTMPEDITVYPPPDLVIDYAMPPPTYVCSIFDFSAHIRNQGAGPARNLNLSTSQPHIIDLATSRQLDFQIVSATLMSFSQGGSLNLAVGDLLPGQEITAFWRLTANAEGRFVEFTSDYSQSNLHGLPVTPRISRLTTTFTSNECISTAFTGVITPVWPLNNSTPITVMQGGIGYRYFRLTNATGAPLANATVLASTGDSSVSDQTGLVTVTLSVDKLGGSGYYIAQIRQVTVGGQPYSTGGQPSFPVTLVKRRYSQVWGYGSGAQSEAGAGAYGVRFFAAGSNSGGLEITLDRTDPTRPDEDKLQMKQDYALEGSLGAEVGASGGVGAVVTFDGSATVTPKFTLRGYGSATSSFDHPYTAIQQLVQGVVLLTSSADANAHTVVVDPRYKAIAAAGLAAASLNPYVSEREAGIAMLGSLEGNVKIGVGIGLGDVASIDIFNFNLVKDSIQHLRGGSYIDYPAAHEFGLAINSDDEVQFSWMSGELLGMRDALLGVINDHTSGVKIEAIYAYTGTHPLRRLEISYIGTSTGAYSWQNKASQVTFKETIQAADLTPAAAQQASSVIGQLISANTPQSSLNIFLNSSALLGDLSALMPMVHYYTYETTARDSTSTDILATPEIKIGNCLATCLSGSVGQSVSVDTAREIVRERGAVVDGRVYPGEGYFYDPYVTHPNTVLSDYASNSLIALWNTVSHLFPSNAALVNPFTPLSLGTVVTSSTAGSVGGTTMTAVSGAVQSTGTIGIGVMGWLPAGSIVSASSRTVPLAASSYPGNGHVSKSTGSALMTLALFTADQSGHDFVGGIYEYSPVTLTIMPAATLILTYTDAALAGRDPSAVAMYRWNELLNNWQPVPAQNNPTLHAVTALVNQLGIYALAIDQTPPQITFLQPQTGDVISNTQPPIHVLVTDNGLGVNPASTQVTLDGQIVDFTYLTITNELYAQSPGILAYGIHTVTVIAADVLSNSVSQDVIFTVWPALAPTAVSIVGANHAYASQPTGYTATVSPQFLTEPITFVWQIQGVAPVTHTVTGITDANPFVWASPGVYTITLTAFNTLGVVTSTMQVTAQDVAITGLVAGGAGAQLGSLAAFTTSIASGTNVSYSWNFGDGHTSSGSTVSHLYAVVGTYTAVVTAANSVTTQTALAPVQIVDIPITGLSAQNNSPTLLTGTTTLSATVNSGTNVSFTWAFGDGQAASGSTVNHQYVSPGAYTAVVTATNGRGNVMATTTVYINDVPVTGLSVRTSVAWLGQTTLLTASLNTGTNVLYMWSLGDGASGPGATVTHVFVSPGLYSATVTATNSVGTTSAGATALVYGPPAASFTLANPSWAHVTTAFTNTTAVAPVSDPTIVYLWSFGDSFTSTAATPAHGYATSGIYTAVLTATNAAGNSTVAKTLTVYGTPQITMTANPAAWTGVSTAFGATASTLPTGDPTILYRWSFGDGASSSITNPQHSFASAGVYTIVVTATNAAGSNAVSQILTVYSRPVVLLTATSPGWLGQFTAYTVTVSTTPPGDTSITTLFNFGDGATGVGVTQTHQYAAAGLYTAIITASNLAGSITATQPIVIYGIPNVTQTNNSPVWLGQTTALTASVSSAPLGDTSIGATWNYGDGTFGQGLTTTHQYAAAGQYAVAVTATNLAGSKVVTQTVKVYSAPSVTQTTSVQGWRGQPVVYSASVSTQPAGDPTISLAWLYGDGTSGAGLSPTHTYTNSGQYTAIVTATNAAGNSASSRIITVYSAPTVTLALVSPGWVSQTNTYTASAGTVPAGDPTIIYTWDYGDGTTGAGITRTHKYLNSGIYPVVVTATNAAGFNAVFGVITVYSTPSVTLIAGSPVWLGQATGYTTTYSTTPSLDPSITFQWTFGDGATATGLTNTHRYATAGLFRTVLTATNPAGSASANQFVTVYSAPTMTVMANGPYWLGQTTAYSTSVSTVPPGDPTILYSWSFGDGSTSSGLTQTHQYLNPGLYTTTVTATNVAGRAVVSPTVVVYSQPTVTLTTDSPYWLGQTTLYTASAVTVPAGDPSITYLWDYGDGSGGTGMTQTHRYASSGLYTTTVTATNAAGQNTASRAVIVYSAPTITLSTSSPNWLGQGTVFTTNVTTAPASDPTITYRWDFGDSGTSTASNPGHTYLTAGTYTVVYTATNAAGRDVATRTVIVYNAPSVSLSTNSPNWLGQGTIFTTSVTTIPAGDPTVTYRWNFGDGGTSTASNPGHTYNAAGTYSVVYTATNAAGQNSATRTVIVYSAPSVTLLSSSPNWLGQATVFTPSVTTVPAGDPTISYRWDFGDGSTSTASNPGHTYGAAGNYTVVFTATNAAGQNAATRTVIVYSAPTVALSVSSPNWLGQGTVFTPSATTVPAGDPTITYRWDFGDGGTSTAGNPGHIYTAAGTYTVAFTATNAAGQSTAAQTLLVYSAPSVSMTASSPNWLGQATLITSSATTVPSGDPTIIYRWNFGDGITSTAGNPGHTYGSAGAYAMVFSAANGAGQNAITRTVIVYSAPAVSLSTSTPNWLGQATVFTTSVTTVPAGDPTVTYRWDFGDGITSTASNPGHTYGAAGTYTVAFTATNAAGQNTTTRTVIVYSAPAVSLGTSSPNWLGQGTVFTTSATTIPAGDPTLSYRWDFGDGGTATTSNPGHTYSIAGTYTVVFTATNAAGQNTATRTVIMYSAPSVSLSTSSPNWLGQATVFTQSVTTVPAGDPTITYRWDFGDGNTSTASNPGHTYNAAGTYTVTITATNAAGQNTATRTVIVYSAPSVSLSTSSPNWLGQGTIFTPSVATVPAGDPTVTYRWDFSDGSTSTVSNPGHTYLTAGTYTVVYTATNAAGQNVATRIVIVYSAPSVSLSTSSPNWLGQAMVFTTSVTTVPAGDPTISYRWDFGDGSTFTASNLGHTYLTAGTYTVVYTATNAAGRDVATRSVIVYSAPSVSLTASSPNWLGQATVFTTSVTTVPAGDPTISYRWDFGDGVTSTASNPGHTYSAAGTYTVVYTATNVAGRDVATRTVIVYSAPSVSLSTSSPNWLGQGTVFTPTATTVPAGDPTLSYRWDFGDGSTSTANNPGHTYIVAGTYTVAFTATNAAGRDIATRTVIVYSAPSVILSTSSPNWLGQATVFTASVTTIPAGDPTVTNRWDFGDGNSSTASNPGHTYLTAGTYTVVYTATNAAGRDIATRSVIVYSAPSVSLSTSSPNWLGQGTVFTPSVTTIPLGDPTISYRWDFGDGNTSTASNPGHTYLTAGAYTVVYSATNAAGQNTATRSVIVYSAPSVILSTSSPNWLGQATVFTQSVMTVPAGDLTVTYRWDFGDGSTSTASNPGHTYLTAGTYTVVYTATNAAGRDVATRTVIVYSAPTVTLTTSSPNWLGQGTVFTPSATTVPAGDPTVTYRWDFGDGNTSTASNPGHTYLTAGTYTVVYTATNVAGRDAVTRTVIVYSAPSVSLSTSSPNWLGQGTVFTPTATTVPVGDPTVTYRWDFGDGSTSTASSPGHTYLTAGTYTVVYTATNAAGRDLATRTVIVYSGPTVTLTTSSPNWLGQGTVFTSIATTVPAGDPTVTYRWDFGDGSTSTASNPGHTYLTAGTYTAVYTATNAAGRDVATRTVIVYGAPTVTLTASSPNWLGQGTVLTTSVATVPAGDPTISYRWDFGDGSSSTASNPGHTYLTAGTYTVVYTATNAAGWGVATRSVIVYSAPSVSLSTNGPNWLGQATVFTTSVTTVPAGDPTISYHWDFGDGITSTASNPGHTYISAGTYTVAFTATNAAGQNTVTRTVIVYSAPSVTLSTSSPNWLGQATVFTTSVTTMPADDPTISYRWDFGDGSMSTANNPGHTYLTSGTYTVVYTATNAAGRDIAMRNVIVYSAPSVSLSTSSPNWLGQTTVFTTNVTTVPVSDPTVSYHWDFGDGSMSTASNLGHTYIAAGIYTVAFTATNAAGQSAVTRTVVIYGTPTVTLTTDSPTILGHITTYTATATTQPSPDSTLTYVWDFGDGKVVAATSVITHVYAYAGSYHVVVSATNAAGFAVAAVTVDVTNRTPVAVTSVVLSATVGATVTLDASASFDPDGHTPLTYHWQQTGGQIVLLQGFDTAVASFVAPAVAGALTVTLQVTDSYGLAGIPVMVSVAVHEAPIAHLQITDTDPTTLGQVTWFTATATGANVTYSWAFGDGSAATGPYQLHLYSQAAIYTVSLSATNEAGTVNATVTVTVTNLAPIARVVVSQTVFVGSAVRMDGSSSFDPDNHYPLTYYWSQTGGSPVLLQSLTQSVTGFTAPPQPGQITLTLQVTDAYGLAGQIVTIPITVQDKLLTAITVTNTGPTVLGRATIMTATGDATNIAFTWDLGDGAHLSGSVVTHIYAVAGYYTVTITGTNGISAVVIWSHLTVFTVPATGFAVNAIGWIGIPTVFTNTSTLGTGDPAVQYLWDFGDGSIISGSQTVVSHTYAVKGVFAVTLTGTNLAGSHSATTTITVYGRPVPGFIASPVTGTAPLLVQFVNTTVPQGDPSLAYYWDYGDGVTSTLTTPSHSYNSAGTYTATLFVSNAAGPGMVTALTVITVYKPVTGSIVVSPSAGNVLTISAGFTATVMFSPGTYSTALTITYQITTDLVVTGLQHLIGDVIILEAYDSAGNRITQFQRPITLTINYSAQQANGLDEASLSLCYWDVLAQTWVRIPSTVNRATHTITVIISHFTRFAVMGNQWLAYLPVIKRP